MAGKTLGRVYELGKWLQSDLARRIHKFVMVGQIESINQNHLPWKVVLHVLEQ
jgi:hypothetical protein